MTTIDFIIAFNRYDSKIAAKPVVGSGSDHNTFSGKIYFYPHRKKFINLPIHCID